MPRRFDFISPGVQLREVDQSQITPTPEEDGLLLIGRAPMGPAMQPVIVRNFADFRETFGDPVSGQSPSSDPWRGGNYATPSHQMPPLMLEKRDGRLPLDQAQHQLITSLLMDFLLAHLVQ